MKKVLSVLLAAAMVMGMSVSAFAAPNYTWDSKSTDDAVGKVDSVYFPGVVWHMKDDNEVTKVNGSNTIENLEPGDNLYFPLFDVEPELIWVLTDEGAKIVRDQKLDVNAKAGDPIPVGWAAPVATTVGQTDGNPVDKEVVALHEYTGKIDSDWSINIEGTEYVQTAYFVAWAPGTTGVWGYQTGAKYLNSDLYEKFVCVELVDDLDETANKTVSFEMYLDDDQYINCVTNTVIFDEVKFANYNEVHKVSFTKTNNVDEPAVWAVAKNAKGEATFDFADEAFFTVKMYSEDKVTFNFSQTYDKAVDKLFDYEVVEFYNFKGSKDAFSKVGELFIPADEDTFIYEIVDGEAVEVEAEYVEDYTITNVLKKHSGWLIETDELGYYVVSDVEITVEEEVEEPAVEVEVEAEKANPETGAADFVGAAVAMAVVSVAAAGALALKK